MDKSEAVLLKLLSSTLRNNTCSIEESVEDIDWEQVYKEAVAHKVHTLLYPVVSGLSGSCKPDEEIILKWKRNSFATGMKLLQNYHRLGEVLNGLNKAGIKVIALKGLVLNELYPNPELRIMSDADILVHEADIAHASRILSEMGYIAEKDKDMKHVIFFHTQFIPIELHRRLVEYDCIKNKEDFDKIVWTNPRQVEVCGAPVLALEWELQVIHTCLHMAFHIVDGGIGWRQLCDLVVIVESKRDEINWSLVVEKSIEYGVAKFVYALFEICRRLLDMQVPAELADEVVNNHLYIEKLISDIFSSQDFGKKSGLRLSANILLKNSSADKGKLYKNRFIQVITLLFPSPKKLSVRFKYRYIEKYPILTPVAWFQRIFHSVFRKDISWKSKISMFSNNEFLDMAEERDDLLHWFGLR